MKVECVLGNIVSQPDAKAVVNSANAVLRSGSGVAGAIHRAAGHSLESYCAQFAPLGMGKAIITPGFNLPNPWIIHIRAGHYMFDDEPKQYLEKAFDSLMSLSEKSGIRSLAVPAVGTGVFAFPPAVSASIMMRVLKKYSDMGTSVQWVRICVTDTAIKQAFSAAIDRSGIKS